MPVGISGLSSDIDSQALIKKLVDVEKRPIARMKEEKGIINLKIDVLKTLNNKLKKLRDSVHPLYGFDSVFKLKKAFGVNEDYFSAIPTQYALPGDIKMQIEQLAQSHYVASDPLPKDLTLPKGVFLISVGTNEKKVNFEGESISDLVKSINEQADSLVQASVINNTPDTVIFSLKSKITGHDNAIGIEDTNHILSKLKLFRKKNTSSFSQNFSNFDPETLNNYNGYKKDSFPQIKGFAEQHDGILFHNKAGEQKIDEQKIDSQTYIDLEYKFVPYEKPQTLDVSDDSKLLSRLFSVTVKDVTIEGAPDAVNSGESKKKEKSSSKVEAESGIGIFALGGKRQEKLFPLESSTNLKTVSFPLKGFNKIKGLIFYSFDEIFSLLVKKVRIYSKSKAEYEFARTLQEPKNAKFKVNDIEVERSKNNGIDDVIENVTLNLKKKMDVPITFKVDHDSDTIDMNIVSFLSNYNQIMDLIIEIQKSSKNSKPGEYDKSKSGLFSADMAIGNIRSKLRSLVMSPYPTSISNKLALLAQSGISTGEWKSAFEDVRTGKLKFNKNKFNQILKSYPSALRELFGSDTDNNHLIDNGMAYKMYEFLRMVAAPKSGIIDVKIASTKEELKSKDKQIVSKEKNVSEYEDKLKRKFLNMEKNLSGLNAQKKWLDQKTKSMNKSQ